MGLTEKSFLERMEYMGLYDPNSKQRKQMTNADRLNAMSIEEKAAFLQSIITNLPWCKPDAPVDPETKQCLIFDCDKCVIEWLKQEATADA